MSAQIFLKLEEALELLNSLDSDQSDVEIAVLPPNASELTDKDQGDENEVNTGESIVKDVPGSLEKYKIEYNNSSTCKCDKEKATNLACKIKEALQPHDSAKSNSSKKLVAKKIMVSKPFGGIPSKTNSSFQVQHVSGKKTYNYQACITF
ncbi:hypothetical protein TNCT_537891 [Trichonephila clavata]|uniref:Uncharacterized protein n=1 Tax=Trichonephila clavata TaxID=2740835 RepID=A0A8X6IX04_TRICU|nr:hypothetical protein TNCT_537891 [Trichonephila clavata]